MNRFRLILTLPLLGLLAMPAMAGRYHDGGHAESRVEQRLDRQHARIKHGIRNGELTRREAKRLRRQQRHIAKMERRFTRDGHLDGHERRTLRRELDAASDRIYRLKHNDRHRHRYDTHGHYDRHHHDGGWSVRLNYWDRL